MMERNYTPRLCLHDVNRHKFSLLLLCLKDIYCGRLSYNAVSCGSGYHLIARDFVPLSSGSNNPKKVTLSGLLDPKNRGSTLRNVGNYIPVYTA
jgi:hypothetical protein